MADRNTEVDLRSDEPNEDEVDGLVNKMEGGPDLETPEPEPEEETVDVDAKAKQQAKRFLSAADGESVSERERARNALKQAHETYQTHQQQRQKVVQQATQSERKVAQFEKTAERVEETPNDVPVFQSLGGGVTVGVPPEADGVQDRSGLIDDLEEAAEAADEKADKYRERAESMETESKVLEAAIRRLKGHCEMFDEA